MFEYVRLVTGTPSPFFWLRLNLIFGLRKSAKKESEGFFTNSLSREGNSIAAVSSSVWMAAYISFMISREVPVSIDEVTVSSVTVCVYSPLFHLTAGLGDDFENGFFYFPVSEM